MVERTMPGFSEFFYLHDVDALVVCVPEDRLPSATLLEEGQWVDSGKADWMLRVDAANPAIPLQRHVHIARAKHVAAKDQQASWNQDRTRHDKGSFNTYVGSQRVVQDLARAALNLDPGVILEQVVAPAGMLFELYTGSDPAKTIYLRVVEG